jgi:hypothetical protein
MGSAKTFQHGRILHCFSGRDIEPEGCSAGFAAAAASDERQREVCE